MMMLWAAGRLRFEGLNIPGPAHQREGLLWDLWRQREGGVVGDEMGLGKTAQVAAFLGAVADKQECRTCLVLAPTTMLAHWRREPRPGHLELE